MELNDINLLVLTGLVSFSWVGVSLFLTFCGRFLGCISPVVAERIWSWMLTVVGEAGTWGRRRFMMDGVSTPSIGIAMSILTAFIRYTFPILRILIGAMTRRRGGMCPLTRISYAHWRKEQLILLPLHVTA